MKPINALGKVVLYVMTAMALAALLALQLGCAKSPAAPPSLECEHCMGSSAEECAGCRSAIMAWSE